jgi:DNA-binding transcriptional LysR family regulator
MRRHAPVVDLNLLRVLLVLHRTHHVTRAAELLGMSQSGFSSALSRLRRLCDDPLFLRAAGGMIETPKAGQLIGVASAAVAAVERELIAPSEFDPASAQTEFRLVMADIAEIVFLPRLLEHLKQVAAHATIRSDAMSKEPLQQALQEGGADLALGYFPDLGSPAFYRQRLYRHTFACIVRRGHPLDHGRMTASAFSRFGHIIVGSPSRSSALFESWLGKQRIKRSVALHTPHHLSLPAMVEASDLMATVPLALAVWFARHEAVQIVPLPFTPPTFEVCQHWHRRFHKDERHRWIRRQVSLLFNERSDDWKAVERSLYGGRRFR